MNISEAKRLVTNMVNEHKALAVLAEALTLLEGGDQAIEGLIRRKKSAEDELSYAQERLRDAEKMVASNIDEINKSLDEKRVSANKEISDFTSRISALRQDLSDTTAKIQSETQRLVAEQRGELNKLDTLIKDRIEKLDKMNQEIEKVRNKIMG